jgi:Ca2+/H+ antiporter, TMEM165/GDT1 family
MRLRSRYSPLLLLLLPSLTSTALAAPPDNSRQRAARAVAPSGPPVETSSIARSKYDVGTKAAPVDGKDGKPHDGPFVEIDRKVTPDDGEAPRERPALKGRPEDPTIIDGKKIPDVNDGVMDDKDRQRPKEGTTGTEGGVSEKDKARKAKEGKTGEKMKTKPETPKEAPPLPHSEEEKILGEKDAKKDAGKDKTKADAKSSDNVAGLEVRRFLSRLWFQF